MLYQASLETRRSSEYHAQEREVDLGQLWQVCPCGWREPLSGELADEGRRCNVGLLFHVILKALLSLSVSLIVVSDPTILCLALVKK